MAASNISRRVWHHRAALLANGGALAAPWHRRSAALRRSGYNARRPSKARRLGGGALASLAA